MDYSLIIVRYGEIGLKSPKVRSRFERKLVKNIKATFDCEVERNQGRIYVYPKDLNVALNKLNKVFGIVSYSPAAVTYTDVEDIDSTLEKYVDNLVDMGILTDKTTFAIKCRRVGNHSFTSQEMAGHCGAVVVRKVRCPVDLTNPQVTIFVEVREGETFIFHEKIQGTGGLPLGTQGKVISLLSSGIDSPVATYLMMKRGCEVIALHFDGAPYTKSKSREKFDKLVDVLNEYACGVPIKKRIVPYGDYLEKCINTNEKMTCVLCKSGMYQIASKLAEKTGALAIVDGSSVGQVASQTLANILATRYDSTYPILSPLIGLDKLEIEKFAKEIGTFEISKENDGGCDAVPKYPETKADMEKVNEAKDTLNQKEILEVVFKNISKE